jgi:ABC-type dipeptide/oligopeptide/nickel transport system permease component
MLNAYTYKSNWWGFVGRRMLIAVLAFFVLSMLAYIAFHGVWGPDNAVNILNATPTYKTMPEMDVLMAKYTSGKGRLTQYLQWLGSFFTGEWGRSIIREVPVRNLLF